MASWGFVSGGGDSALCPLSSIQSSVIDPVIDSALNFPPAPGLNS